MNLILLLATGMLTGALHVLSGPDHLAAIAPLAADKPVKWWKIGFWWGLGHSGSVWMMGIVIFLLRAAIPLEKISAWGEKGVGLLLIGLGMWYLQKVIMMRIQDLPHEHKGFSHSHFYLNLGSHSHLPFNIGILHGLAGSSHFLAVLPALALPSTLSAIFYVAGFGIGTILAMTVFSWCIGLVVGRLWGVFTKTYRSVQIGFAAFAIGTGISWLFL